MKFTKGAALLVALIYAFLWVLALHGVSSLVAPLAVPLVLAILVALGVWLNRFMGIAPRHQHFEDPVPDATASGTPRAGPTKERPGPAGGVSVEEPDEQTGEVARAARSGAPREGLAGLGDPHGASGDSP